MQRRHLPTSTLIALTGATLVASTATGQQMDMAAYNKWATVTVVHYVVVGEFAADTFVAGAAGGPRAKASVKDRLEVTFDWDAANVKLLGTPVIKNFPTTITNIIPYGGCGIPKLTGQYEHTTLLSVADNGVGNLKTSLKREGVAAVIQTLGDASVCGGGTPVPAATQTTAGMLLVAPPMYYAMPPSGGTKLSTDKKSIIISDGAGWTWTYTLTAVR